MLLMSRKSTQNYDVTTFNVFSQYFLGEFKKIEQSDEGQRKHRLLVFLASDDSSDVKTNRCLFEVNVHVRDVTQIE